MALQKLPFKIQDAVRNCFLKLKTAQTLTLEEEIHIFAEELKRHFSESEIERLARSSKYVQRKGKLAAWQIVSLCCFSDMDVANDTLVGCFCTNTLLRYIEIYRTYVSFN